MILEETPTTSGQCMHFVLSCTVLNGWLFSKKLSFYRQGSYGVKMLNGIASIKKFKAQSQSHSSELHCKCCKFWELLAQYTNWKNNPISTMCTLNLQCQNYIQQDIWRLKLRYPEVSHTWWWNSLPDFGVPLWINFQRELKRRFWCKGQSQFDPRHIKQEGKQFAKNSKFSSNSQIFLLWNYHLQHLHRPVLL